MITLPVWLVWVLLGLAALGLILVVLIFQGFIDELHRP